MLRVTECKGLGFERGVGRVRCRWLFVVEEYSLVLMEGYLSVSY